MACEATQVLLAVEAEAYVEALETIPVKDVGNPRWRKQHEYLEKLNMQAVINASANEDEFIKEMLITHEKIPVVIHELLIIEIWRQKVFPIIQKINFDPETTFPIYMALYHEATLANLLETVLYHRDPCESAEDCILDLADYCHRKVLYLIARQEEEREGEVDVKTVSDKGSMEGASQSHITARLYGSDQRHLQKMPEMISFSQAKMELKNQDRKLQFEIGIKAVSILRYITDHMAWISLSVTTRILNTHDIPCLLVQLVVSPPWTVFKKGKLQKFIDNKWQLVPVEERLKLTKLEGQVWIALFNLLMGSASQEKYQFNTYNKNQILKLRGHLSEVILDQIPCLCDLQRYLGHLAMMDPPAAKTGLVLEQVPEVRDTILKQNEGKWGAIAKHQVKTAFNPSPDQMRQQAKMFADTYNFDALETLISAPPKCVLCGEPACKRCSRCQNEWYCRRECQVKHWSKHKQACNLLADAQKKLKESSIS